MAEFAAAYLVFLLTHAIPARPGLRARLVAALGGWGFTAAYSVVSALTLAWLISAAGRAPYVHLWGMASWQLWVPIVLMPFACLFAVFGVGAPNPLSFGGLKPERFDPAQPGIVGLTRHPILWALALWGLAHLVPNGNATHLAMFGGLFGFAIVGMLAIDRRKRRALGREAWSRLAANAPLIPFSAWLRANPGVRSWRPSPLRGLIAVIVFVALLALHRAVIGVSPLPVIG